MNTIVNPQAPRALLERWPELGGRLPFARLGDLPTPVTSLEAVARAAGHPGVELYEKRDDLTSPIYGGNKVRTLEVLFGHALALGATEIYSTGAYGSNHAAAAAVHAPRVGLTPGVCLYPQPEASSALENLELILSRKPRPRVHDLPHWSALLWGMWQTGRECRRRGVRAYVMDPGGAIPLGALGYVSAGLELAEQVERKELPEPKRIVVAAGSNCTVAGLLVGLSLAAERRIGFTAPPELTAVRVTPWPVSSALRIFRLAVGASSLLAELTGDPSVARTRRALAPRFSLLSGFLGRGYGFATESGRRAADLWSEHGGHDLETTYSGKSAAAVIDMLASHRGGPLLYWSTKTSAALPAVDRADLAWAPARMQRWMTRARSLNGHG